MNIRLSVFAVAIFALLTSCDNTTPATTTTDAPAATATQGSIVYIRLDSLSNQYTAFKDMMSALETKANEADKNQNQRVASFQRDVQNLQRRANSGQMAPKEIGTEQERLAGREQALMQEADRLRQELQLEQLKIMGEFEENLQAVLEEVQKEFKYDYILSYGAGTGVLMAAEELDITPEVAKRINNIPMDGKMKEAATQVDSLGNTLQK